MNFPVLKPEALLLCTAKRRGPEEERGCSGLGSGLREKHGN